MRPESTSRVLARAGSSDTRDDERRRRAGQGDNGAAAWSELGRAKGNRTRGGGRILWARDGASRGRNGASWARSNGAEDGLARRGCPSAMALALSGGRAEAGPREESGKRRVERELEPCQLGEERDGSGRRCLRVLDRRERRGSGTCAGSRGRAIARPQARQGSGAGRRRRGTGGAGVAWAATARARASAATARGVAKTRRGACRGWSREREGELGSSSAHTHAHARAAHGQSEGRAEGERERERVGPRGNRPTAPEGGKLDFCGEVWIRNLNSTTYRGFEIRD